MYPQVFGKYVLERELSRGGMARVLLATLRGAGGFEKKLVVKQIRDELSFDQQFVNRFVEEAKTTVALSHPNIVPVYELGVEQGTYFLAMELVEGCSIAEIIRERNDDGSRRLLSPEEGAYVGMEVCRALDYAHRRMQVVHRDITPRNVMLDEEGQVKLIDFGIAAPALVAGHEILGSPGHMPPEQVEGQELGPPTDIFAVAVLLMEAWTGVAPFRRATPEECDAAMRMPHPRPSDYNARLIPLDDVITRAMKLDPRERQQDASELRRALRAFLQGTDVTDIARELGDRVRLQREIASEPQPMSIDGRPIRKTNPSVGDLGTKTFAAREEAIRWSRPPPSEIEPVLDDPPGASTRRLPASDDGPVTSVVGAAGTVGESEAGESEAGDGGAVSSGARRAASVTLRSGDVTEKRRSYARPLDPAMSIPTPFMVESLPEGSDVMRAAKAAREAARAALPDTPPMPHVRPSDPRSDTLATGGLERGVPSSSRDAPSSRSRVVPALVVAAVLAIGAGVAWRARSAPVVDAGTKPNAAVASVTAPAVTAAAPVSTVVPGVAVPGAAVSGAAVSGAAVSGAAVPVPSASTSGSRTVATPTVDRGAGEKAGKALVQFLGEPGTRVSIDGASRGPTPVRVSIDPGQHDVRFQFDPTGESRGERFSVKASEKITIRAEFTGASPTVRIQR